MSERYTERSFNRVPRILTFSSSVIRKILQYKSRLQCRRCMITNFCSGLSSPRLMCSRTYDSLCQVTLSYNVNWNLKQYSQYVRFLNSIDHFINFISQLPGSFELFSLCDLFSLPLSLFIFVSYHLRFVFFSIVCTLVCTVLNVIYIYPI